MGRPRLHKVKFPVSLPPELLSALDAHAAERHTSRTTLVEEAVRDFLARVEKVTRKAKFPS